MSAASIPAELRQQDFFHHIDMGFLNRRLAMTALPPEIRPHYVEHAKPGTDHFTVLGNDHLLVTMLLDVCRVCEAPTLAVALTLGKAKHLFCSTERLAPCPGVYDATRVEHEILLPVDAEKPIRVAYHTSHIVSSTGRMTLALGAPASYAQSIIGLLYDKGDRFEVEPIVMGAPWFDHPRNKPHSLTLMWCARDMCEILPEDIQQFERMSEVPSPTATEWMVEMRQLPEAVVKQAITSLLGEPSKKDWGGEANDHYSANVTVGGVRRTAAFMFKGPADFREMTLDMCGKRADQIYRLATSGADISIVQHAHQVGQSVRETLRAHVVQPGRARKFCVMDGQATYRLLRAYNLFPSVKPPPHPNPLPLSGERE